MADQTLGRPGAEEAPVAQPDLSRRDFDVLAAQVEAAKLLITNGDLPEGLAELDKASAQIERLASVPVAPPSQANPIMKAPNEITLANLEVVVMPNGEVICGGTPVGWVSNRGKFLTPKSASQAPVAVPPQETPQRAAVDARDVARAMMLYGGSFVQLLGQLYLRADPDNAERLQTAFPDYFRKYADMSATPKEPKP